MGFCFNHTSLSQELFIFSLSFHLISDFQQLQDKQNGGIGSMFQTIKDIWKRPECSKPQGPTNSTA